MKRERLLRIIGDIDDEFIDEALIVRNKSYKKLFIGIAACFAVILIISAVVSFDGELPMLTVKELNDSSGFEGYWFYDIDEFKSANPWSEDVRIKKLPVFRNTYYGYTKEWTVKNPDTEKMEELLFEAAKKLDMDTSLITEALTENENGECLAVAEDESYRIEVNSWLILNVTFKKNVLPGSFSVKKGSTYNDLYNSADCLKILFKDFMDMKKPCIDISKGDYDINKNRVWTISFYDSSGDDCKKIMNYNFERVYFYTDEGGRISSASRRYIQGDIMGIYPVIDEREAIELLCSGNYLTSVTDEKPNKERIGKIELIYRNEMTDEVFMPYYKFYVLLESHSNEEMSCYGAYYVPAVDGKYIRNMPLTDGIIN